jgi:hypothetical protein
LAFISNSDSASTGWPDILLCNGHVYPETGDTGTEAGYRPRKVLYRNLGNGRFRDVSLDAGLGILEIHRPSGLIEKIEDVKAYQILRVVEGRGVQPA